MQTNTCALVCFDHPMQRHAETWHDIVVQHDMASMYVLLQQSRIPFLIVRATQIRVKWFARKEWLEQQQFKWSKNPTFIAARSPSTGRAP
eukprot:3113474-Pleurochrysis_carterae.AAC.1